MAKPVVMIVMDGVGIREDAYGNAVSAANTPVLDGLFKNDPWVKLKAHGTAVGLPSDDDMGNSEVGHNALGCGQIYAQGAKLVNESIESGDIYNSNTWKALISGVKASGGALHFIGLLSDGGVHSNIAHLEALIKEAKREGVTKVRLHALLDGRDVPAQSGLIYIDRIEKLFSELNDGGFNAAIASGGGRMKMTMDRYNADWEMVRRGYAAHVRGEGDFLYSAAEAINAARKDRPDVIDQDLPPFVIVKDGEPIGRITDGDSVILFNFRGDRAIEISRAFDEAGFRAFDRGVAPKVIYAGMLQYDGDLKIPKNFLVNPPTIKNTLSETLVGKNIKQYAVSETQKFGHVTYFWNGNRTEKFSRELEDFCEVESDRVSFDERPWMKAAEVTDKILAAMESGEYGFIRANYPNGDMVGHTGNFDAAVIAVEAVDLCLARVLAAADRLGYTLIITADHGNADEMFEKDKKGNITPKTAHTLNPVPFIIHDKDGAHHMKDGAFGLANAAATVCGLLGIEPQKGWEESLLKEG